MADFIYVGEYPNGESVVSFGVVFQLGTPTTLTNADEIQKARNNQFFEEIVGSDELLHQEPNSNKNIVADESDSTGANRKRGRPKLLR